MSTIRPINQASALIDKSDEELFEKMALNNGAEANGAFVVFHNRYKGYLWKACLYVTRKNNLNETIAEDIFQNTLIKVYTRASTFKANVGVKAWLGKIASHELINYYRKNQIDSIDFLPYDEVPEKEEDQTQLNVLPTLNQIKLDNALELLTEQERHILMTYMRYFDFQNPKRHLPTTEMEKLCEIYKTSSDNIRQIKHRALKKVKNNIL